MKGIVLAGGTGSRLWPVTNAICKQLLPVYDKPMIYYPISTLMLAGIREIAIISTVEDKMTFKRLLGNGDNWGVHFEYFTQLVPDGIASAYLIAENFIDSESSALILGDNIFFGSGLGSNLTQTSKIDMGGRIFGYQVSDPSSYGVAVFNEFGKVSEIHEKPESPSSTWAVPGLYFLDGTASLRAHEVIPSTRGEKEITDLLQSYINEGALELIKLQRGSVWMDMGNPQDLASASEFVKLLELRQKLKISCPEEISWRNGWISDEQLLNLGSNMSRSQYGIYLMSLVN